MHGREGEPQSWPLTSFSEDVSKIIYLKEWTSQGGKNLEPQALLIVGGHLRRQFGVPVARGTWDFHWLLLCTDDTRKSITGVCMFEGHRQGFFG